jgi:hypothetical protein
MDRLPRRPSRWPRRPAHLQRGTGPLLLATTVLAVVAACGDVGRSVPPTHAAASDGALVTIETRGGLCPDGPCGSTVVVERNGRIRLAAKPPNDLGTADAARLAAVEAAIAATDFDELRSHPFTGTCPTAYDGQEVVLSFATPGGIEVVASCEVAIDPHDPLFRAVADALGPSVALPSAPTP